MYKEFILLDKNNNVEKKAYAIVKFNFDNNDYLIYSIDENNQQKIFQRTGIVVDYLPEIDKLNLKNGIRVNGKENLNKMLEDFE